MIIIINNHLAYYEILREVGKGDIECHGAMPHFTPPTCRT